MSIMINDRTTDEILHDLTKTIYTERPMLLRHYGEFPSPYMKRHVLVSKHDTSSWTIDNTQIKDNVCTRYIRNMLLYVCGYPIEVQPSPEWYNMRKSVLAIPPTDLFIFLCYCPISKRLTVWLHLLIFHALESAVVA